MNKKIPRLQPREARKILTPIMTATTTKAVKATLTFDVRVQVSVQATEAKWKKLTKDYVDPNEPWAEQSDTAIRCFCEDELGIELKEELFHTRLAADIPAAPLCGLKASQAHIDEIDVWAELEEVEA